MPYFAEGDLVSHLAPRAGEGSTARLGRVLRLFRDVLETLAWIHQHGIAHRDIKPTNVLVSTEARACGEAGEHSPPLRERVIFYNPFSYCIDAAATHLSGAALVGPRGTCRL